MTGPILPRMAFVAPNTGMLPTPPASRTPLAILRVVVVVLAVLMAVDPQPPVATWLHLALSLVLVASVVASLWRPLAGALLAALLLATDAVVGSNGYEVLPLVVATVAVVAVEAPVWGVATLGSFLVIAAIGPSGRATASVASALAVTIVVSATVGLGARLLLERARRTHERIGALARRAQRIRVEERAELADELARLLVGSLSGNADALVGASGTRDVRTLRSTLAGVEAAAESSLSRLRMVVTTLRDEAAVAGGGPESPGGDLVAVAEEVEEALAGHGFFVDLRVIALPADLPGYARAVVAALLRDVGALVPRVGLAGGCCRIAVDATASAVITTVAVPLDAAAPAASGPVLADSAGKVRALGGTLVEGRDGDEWTVRLVLPLVPAEDGRPTPASGRGRSGTRWWTPWLRVDARAPVAILGVAVALQTVLTLVALATSDPDWSSPALLAVTYAGLACLIRRPRVGGFLLAAVLALGLFVSPPTLAVGQGPHFAIVGLAALAAWRAPRWSAATVGGWMVYCVLWFRGVGDPATVASLAAGGLIAPLVGIVLGLAVRHFLELRRGQLASLDAATREVRDARASERRQLAGELHDIVAHQLSLIAMQVMAHGSSADPEELSSTVRQVAGINRSAQADLAMLLHVMRDGDDPRPPGPTRHSRLTPTRTLAGLRATLEDAGHPVDVDVAADVDSVDPTTQRTLTRILREAATNILRYAPPNSPCEVRVNLAGDSLDVLVASALAERTPASRHSTGSGLDGLTERVRLTGGSFSAGPEEGRWHVRARLARAGLSAAS